MISLRSLHKRLQGSLGITRSLPLRLGRSRLQLDWYCLESLRNMPFLKGLRLLPNLPALRRLGFVGFWMIGNLCGLIYQLGFLFMYSFRFQFLVELM
ncbi:hypothetical protein OIU76_013029 [Salix suchowensis]|nr:hypothetical protein OIU76_013029 [Salix suchowensis]KAJ6349955.1 hypothetical protein OIU78_006198 [Salix suchowensis]